MKPECKRSKNHSTKT